MSNMDIIIVTFDPSEVDTHEITKALQKLGYFVNSVRVEDRGAWA